MYPADSCSLLFGDHLAKERDNDGYDNDDDDDDDDYDGSKVHV